MYRKACQDAWAIGFQKDSPHDANTARNAAWSEVVGLPAPQPMVGNTFGSSHQNVFLRAILAKKQCDIQTLAPCGVLDPDELMNRFPGLRKSLTEGLQWQIIHPSVVAKWPMIVAIGQKALNFRGTQDVHEFEAMLEMLNTFDHYQSQGLRDDAAWEAALSDVMLNDSFWKPWGRSIMNMAKALTRAQVLEISELRHALVPIPEGAATSWANIGGEFLDKVASLKFSDVVPFPRIKAACMIAQLLSPLDQVKSCRCSLMRANDLTPLVKDKRVKEPNTFCVCAFERVLICLRRCVASAPPLYVYMVLRQHLAHL